MALKIDAAPLAEFIRNFAHPDAMARVLWQAGVGAASIVLGFYVARVICRQITPGPNWKFGAGGFERVAFPLFAAVFMFLGKVVLERYQTTMLVHILLSLTLAWVVIRVAAYVLGHVLPQGSFLRASIRTIAWVAWIAVALHIAGISGDVIDALDNIGVSVGKDKQRITLWLVLQGITALALTLTLVSWISRITENRVMASHALDMSTRVVVTKIVRISAVFLAVLVALPMVGIDITALSIFSGALGVGLGFGLQKIASNYVSGFIVLLDRSLRIGDVVTVDGRKGEVKAIETRYTVIKGLDGVENIIPNETLITQSVSHHTYSDPKVSVVIGLAVGYDADLDLALELMLRAAHSHKRVIDQPAAGARVKNLALHAVELELSVWISDPSVGEGDLRSDLQKDIVRLFRENGVRFPVPLHEVRLLTPETQEKPSSSGT